MTRFLSEGRKIIIHAAHDQVGVSAARQGQFPEPVPLFPPRLWIVGPPQYYRSIDTFQAAMSEMFFQSGIFGDLEYLWNAELQPAAHDSVLLIGSEKPPAPRLIQRLQAHHERGGVVLGVALNKPAATGWEDLLREVFGVRLDSPPSPGLFDIRPSAAGRYHPVLQGVSPFVAEGIFPPCRAIDPDVVPLLVAQQSSQRLLVAWVKARGGLRRFGALLGSPHDFHKPGFLTLLRNAVLWTRGEA
jgi:hypothetical protein